MVSLWGVLVALMIYGTVPAAGGLWLFEKWRSRRRNRRGQCATCGTEWTSASVDERFLIHGRLVCTECGERARRRMPWHFGLLGLGAAAATGIAIAGADTAALILFPPAMLIVTTLGAVQLMKVANRRAQRRIASGEYPGLPSAGLE